MTNSVRLLSVCNALSSPSPLSLPDTLSKGSKYIFEIKSVVLDAASRVGEGPCDKLADVGESAAARTLQVRGSLVLIMTILLHPHGGYSEALTLPPLSAPPPPTAE
mmetsp:Transcript_62891/g.53331  ORF Transcript_62891/g.53331 Transcript_62891/m.53331 type:complete len:106 (-) Transcript_62891:1682-1999(-)